MHIKIRDMNSREKKIFRQAFLTGLITGALGAIVYYLAVA